jgi:hypothetical protein
MPRLAKFAFKDMKIGQTIVHEGRNEVIKALRHHPSMTVIDTEKLTDEKMHSLLKADPDIVIVEG